MAVSYSCASLYLAMYVRRDVRYRYHYRAMYVIRVRRYLSMYVSVEATYGLRVDAKSRSNQLDAVVRCVLLEAEVTV